MALPKKVTLVEVSPRDGLQNESKIVPTDIKIEFINQLSETGLTVIECTSFVSPTRVPQMEDHCEVMRGIKKKPGVKYPVLVPNLRGLKNALACDATDFAVLTAASETFNQKNIQCSTAESLERIQQIFNHLKTVSKPHSVRGYISCVMGCPYEGEIDPNVVANLAEQLWKMGCYEISLGDTIGTGTPDKTKKLIETVSKQVPIANLAVHFHDTYHQAINNISAALEYGIDTIDSSVAGIGGCPYAPGASGNVSTENVLLLLDQKNIKTGINFKNLLAAKQFISQLLL